MTLAFTLLGIIAVLGIAAIVAALFLDSTPAEPRDADAVFEAFYEHLGTKDSREEIPERRFRLAHLYLRKAARFGRRPRP